MNHEIAVKAIQLEGVSFDEKGEMILLNESLSKLVAGGTTTINSGGSGIDLILCNPAINAYSCSKATNPTRKPTPTPTPPPTPTPDPTPEQHREKMAAAKRAAEAIRVTTGRL